MKDDLLLLMESMFLSERRHCLPEFIHAIETQQAEKATKIFHEQIEFLSKLKGVDINIVKNTTGEDMCDFTWLLKKSKRTLLGRLRLIEAREARKAIKDEERIKSLAAALSRRQIADGKGTKSVSANNKN